VTEASIYGWERNTTTPALRHLPAIILFLEYNPLPAADTLTGTFARIRKGLVWLRKNWRGRLGLTNRRSPDGREMKIRLPVAIGNLLKTSSEATITYLPGEDGVRA
jgi:hypothetical protein